MNKKLITILLVIVLAIVGFFSWKFIEGENTPAKNFTICQADKCIQSDTVNIDGQFGGCFDLDASLKTMVCGAMIITNNK